jgi:hypothetical protein
MFVVPKSGSYSSVLLGLFAMFKEVLEPSPLDFQGGANAPVLV